MAGTTEVNPLRHSSQNLSSIIRSRVVGLHMPYTVLTAGIDGTGSMTTLSEIQSEIVSLGTSDYKALRRWFARDWEAWDGELEEDAKSGGLDFLAEEARIAARAGRLLEL